MDDGSCSANVANKQKYIKNLDKFTENIDKILLETCSFIGWDLEKTVKEQDPYVVCPFNQSHKVLERTIEKHLQKCEWKTLGYTDNCIPLPESTVPLESPSTIKIDMVLQHQILQKAKQKNPELKIGLDEKFIPKTADRLFSDFTTDERRIIYDYVVNNTVGPDAGKDISTDISNADKSNGKEPSTAIVELLAAERNLKRRRAKYRGVHTNKKSHSEIMKEVIEQQMDMLREHVSEQLNILDQNLKNENYSSSHVKSRVRKSDQKKYDTVDNLFYSEEYNKNAKDYKFKSEEYLKNLKKDFSSRKPFNNFKNDYKNETHKKFSEKYDKNNFFNDERSNKSNFHIHQKYQNTSKHSNKRDSSHDREFFQSEEGSIQSRSKGECKRDMEKSNRRDKYDNASDHGHKNDHDRNSFKNDESRYKRKYKSEKLEKSDSYKKIKKNPDSHKNHKHKSSHKHKRSKSKSQERKKYKKSKY